MGQIAKSLGLGSEFEYKGKTFKISPWNYKIQGEYELYIEAEAIKAARRMAKHLTQDERADLLKQINRDIAAGLYSFGGELVADSLKSVHHLKQLMWLLLLPNHPGLQKEEVSQMMDDELEQMLAAMDVANADPTQGTSQEG